MRKQTQRGVTLIEILASLAVMSLLVAGLTAMALSAIEDTKSQQAALYQSQLGKAVKNWLGNAANRNAVAGAATATVPVKLTTAQLAQWLPPNFNAVNAYGQSPCVMLYYTAANERIDAAITTEGGVGLDDAQLGYAVNHAGEGAGAIYQSTPTIARGAFGSWQAPVATFTSAAPAQRCGATAATSGRFMTLISMDRNGTNAMGGAGEWLARNAVAGRPDLNRMNTTLDMTGNVIDNAMHVNAAGWLATNSGVLSAGDVTSLSGNLYAPQGSVAARDGYLMGLITPNWTYARLSQGVYFSTIIPNGNAIVKPDPWWCPAGTPQVFASPVAMATNPPMAVYGTTIIDVPLAANQWRPILFVYTQNGWVVGDPNYTRLNVYVKCS